MMRHAIFDLDGTLLDSMDIWENLGETYLRRKDLTPAPDLKERLSVCTLPQAAQYFVDYYGLEQDAKQVVDEICAMIDGRYRNEVPLKDGVASYLRFLLESGVNCCVVTASEKKHAQTALDRLGVLQYFDFIMTCMDAGCAKTQPDIFRTAAQKLGGSPADTTVFEDALHCIKTAKAAGFSVVGVHDASAQRDDAEIRRLCDRYITSFLELEGTT